jgi:hypothetical protein
VRHPWHDGPQRRLSDLEAELEQLAWERTARPYGFSAFIRRISARNSAAIFGRPPNRDGLKD